MTIPISCLALLEIINGTKLYKSAHVRSVEDVLLRPDAPNPTGLNIRSIATVGNRFRVCVFGCCRGRGGLLKGRPRALSYAKSKLHRSNLRISLTAHGNFATRLDRFETRFRIHRM